VLELAVKSKWLAATASGNHFAAGELVVAYGPATWVAADGQHVKLQTQRTTGGLRIIVRPRSSSAVHFRR